MLIRKLGFGLIGLALIVNISARVTQHYQNKPDIITASEFSDNYDIKNFQRHERDFYNNTEYASYALGLSGAALALAGGRRIRIIDVNKE